MSYFFHKDTPHLSRHCTVASSKLIISLGVDSWKWTWWDMLCHVRWNTAPTATQTKSISSFHFTQSLRALVHIAHIAPKVIHFFRLCWLAEETAYFSIISVSILHIRLKLCDDLSLFCVLLDCPSLLFVWLACNAGKWTSFWSFRTPLWPAEVIAFIKCWHFIIHCTDRILWLPLYYCRRSILTCVAFLLHKFTISDWFQSRSLLLFS